MTTWTEQEIIDRRHVGGGKVAFVRRDEAERKLAEWQAAEKETSDAYLRVRALLEAWRTAPGGADRYEVTERAVTDLIVARKRLEEAAAQLRLDLMAIAHDESVGPCAKVADQAYAAVREAERRWPELIPKPQGGA